MNRAILAVCLALTGLAATAQADTLRCGSQLISAGDRQFDVQQKCGAPVSQSIIGYKETVNSFRRAEQVQIEEWIYGPNNGMFQYLRFEGGRLVRFDSKRGN